MHMLQLPPHAIKIAKKFIHREMIINKHENNVDEMVQVTPFYIKIYHHQHPFPNMDKSSRSLTQTHSSNWISFHYNVEFIHALCWRDNRNLLNLDFTRCVYIRIDVSVISFISTHTHTFHIKSLSQSGI